MRRRNPGKVDELNFQNALSTPLGRITIAGFGIRQTVALETPRLLSQYAIVYLVDGRGEFADANGRQKNLERGDMMFLFPDIPHLYNPLPGTEWVTTYICFHGPVFDLWRRQGLLNPRKPVYHAEPVATWSRRLEAVFDASRQAGSAPPLLGICRLQQLLAEVVTGAGRSMVYQDDLQWLARVNGLIETNLAGAPDWKNLARQVGLSAESFRKRFTRLAGQPPARYRMGRLVDRACELMQNRSLKDREIAESLGFCDEFYFSRRFKAVTGQSPRQFRLNSLFKQPMR
ncbi:MAG: AraC family transcriptional regulator [Methylacidiphilales bacterium]|nr:AraC family transcriptional regulator [Candidatus Methylacidiphilales bacterium]